MNDTKSSTKIPLHESAASKPTCEEGNFEKFTLSSSEQVYYMLCEHKQGKWETFSRSASVS